MIKKVISLLIIVLSASYSFSQQTYQLGIEIIGLRSNNGMIMLQLADQFGNLVNEKMVPIIQKTCVILITGIKPGKYALKYFHDENRDGHIDTNMIGIPAEGYGYSNNVIGKYGEPPFKDRIFDLTKDTKLVLEPYYR